MPVWSTLSLSYSDFGSRFSGLGKSVDAKEKQTGDIYLKYSKNEQRNGNMDRLVGPLPDGGIVEQRPAAAGSRPVFRRRTVHVYGHPHA